MTTGFPISPQTVRHKSDVIATGTLGGGCWRRHLNDRPTRGICAASVTDLFLSRRQVLGRRSLGHVWLARTNAFADFANVEIHAISSRSLPVVSRRQRTRQDAVTTKERERHQHTCVATVHSRVTACRNVGEQADGHTTLRESQGVIVDCLVDMRRWTYPSWWIRARQVAAAGESELGNVVGGALNRIPNVVIIDADAHGGVHEVHVAGCVAALLLSEGTDVGGVGGARENVSVPLRPVLILAEQVQLALRRVDNPEHEPALLPARADGRASHRVNAAVTHFDICEVDAVAREGFVDVGCEGLDHWRCDLLFFFAGCSTHGFRVCVVSTRVLCRRPQQRRDSSVCCVGRGTERSALGIKLSIGLANCHRAGNCVGLRGRAGPRDGAKKVDGIERGFCTRFSIRVFYAGVLSQANREPPTPPKLPHATTLPQGVNALTKPGGTRESTNQQCW